MTLQYDQGHWNRWHLMSNTISKVQHLPHVWCLRKSKDKAQTHDQPKNIEFISLEYTHTEVIKIILRMNFLMSVAIKQHLNYRGQESTHAIRSYISYILVTLKQGQSNQT